MHMTRRHALISVPVIAAAIAVGIMSAPPKVVAAEETARPDVGDCYLTPQDYGDLTSTPGGMVAEYDWFAEYPKVRCGLFHTLETYFVGDLPAQWDQVPDAQRWDALDAICGGGPGERALIETLGEVPERLPSVTYVATVPSKASRDLGANWVRCDVGVLFGFWDDPFFARWQGTIAEIRQSGGDYMFWFAMPSRFAGQLRAGRSPWDPWDLLKYFRGIHSGNYGALMIWRGGREVTDPRRAAAAAKAACEPEFKRWLKPSRITREAVTQWWPSRLGNGRTDLDIRCILKGSPFDFGRLKEGHLGPQPYENP